MPATVDLRQNAAPAAAPTRDAVIRQPATGSRNLEWSAPEYIVREKSIVWYAVFGVLLAVLLFVAFLMKSFLTGVVFVLAGLLILLYSERPPRPFRFQLQKDRLLVNDRRYLYADLERYNIVETIHGPLLLIHGKRLLLPLIHVPLADTDPDTVRAAIGAGIKEDPNLREPLPDLIAHWLGF